ncbi:MAG: head GIN domain-containing protein [Kaistella sp.]
MKKIFLFSFFTLLIFSSCRFMGWKGINGSGNIVTQSRETEKFNSIDVSGAIDIYVKQDSVQQSIKVETDDNLQEYIDIHEDNGVLYISQRDNYSLDPSKKIKVYVSAPYFRRFDISGASNIYSENKLVSSETLDIEMSGASEVKLDVKAPRINADITGASSVKISGETKDFNVEGSGASDIKSFDLMTENTTIDISGACSAEVFASVKLDVQASGASGIKYKGNAAVNQDVSGASSVKKVD